MIETGWYSSPNEFQVLPAITIRAAKCDDCLAVHGFQLSLEWFWAGVFINYMRD